MEGLNMPVKDNMYTTRPFMTGRSQAVRIPKEFRLEEKEVVVNKIGDSIIITPVDSLEQAFFSGIDLLTDDFLSEGRPEESKNDEVKL